jgi:hypothetical protein
LVKRKRANRSRGALALARRERTKPERLAENKPIARPARRRCEACQTAACLPGVRRAGRERRSRRCRVSSTAKPAASTCASWCSTVRSTVPTRAFRRTGTAVGRRGPKTQRGPGCDTPKAKGSIVARPCPSAKMAFGLTFLFSPRKSPNGTIVDWLRLRLPVQPHVFNEFLGVFTAPSRRLYAHRAFGLK